MKIAITGASGLVGKALSEALEKRGDTVLKISRSATQGDIVWDLAKGQIEVQALDGCDAIFHLAGESVAQRWNPQRKKAILESRVKGAECLIEAIKKMKTPPKAYISASGVSYYGIRQSEPVDESLVIEGEGFLAEVCRAWEGVGPELKTLGVRPVFMRLGVVLSPDGGLLEKLLPMAKTGLAGPLGKGQNAMSWISLREVVSQLMFALDTPGIEGAVNAVSPHPVSNLEFMKTLAKVLKRPLGLPAPTFMVKMLMGQMAEEMAFSDLKVVPKRLQEAGYTFSDIELESALRNLLK